MQIMLYYLPVNAGIDPLQVMLSFKNLRMETENSCYVGVLGDSSFFRDLKYRWLEDTL